MKGKEEEIEWKKHEWNMGVCEIYVWTKMRKKITERKKLWLEKIKECEEKRTKKEKEDEKKRKAKQKKKIKWIRKKVKMRKRE